MHDQQDSHDSSTASPFVFISNLNSSTMEHHLLPVCQEVGHVRHLQIRRSQRDESLSYAFCEFTDIPAAQAALSILNGRIIHKKRIKCEHAHPESARRSLLAHRYPSNAFPRRRDIFWNEGMSATAQCLRRMRSDELYKAVAQLRAIALEKPDHAAEIFREYPQLAFALLFCFSKMRNGPFPNRVIPPEAFIGSTDLKKITRKGPWSVNEETKTGYEITSSLKRGRCETPSSPHTSAKLTAKTFSTELISFTTQPHISDKNSTQTRSREEPNFALGEKHVSISFLQDLAHDMTETQREKIKDLHPRQIDTLSEPQRTRVTRLQQLLLGADQRYDGS